MFDWVLNTPLFIDGYYLMALLVSMYICLFQNVSKTQFQDHNVVQQFSGVFIFQIQNCLFFLDPKYFYEIAICCIIVITSYNNAILYELNTFIKSKLKVNWRKKLKPLTDAALLIFFQKAPPISYVWILFSHVYSIFCDLDLFYTRVDSC